MKLLCNPASIASWTLFTLFFCKSSANEEKVVCLLAQTDDENESASWLPRSGPASQAEEEPEASNWVVEEGQEKTFVDFESIFKTSNFLFKYNNPNVEVMITFRKLPISISDSLRETVDMLDTKRHQCNAVVYGFFPVRSKSLQHLCTVLEDVLSTWEIPIITWSCLSQKPNIGRNSISVLPSIAILPKATLFLLQHYQWRRVAVVQISHLMQEDELCNQMQKHLLSTPYFLLKFYKHIMVKRTEKERWNETLFDDVWEHLFELDISAVVVCLSQGFKLHQNHAEVVRNLLESGYDANVDKAKRLSYIIMDEFGIYNNTSIFCQDLLFSLDPVITKRSSHLQSPPKKEEMQTTREVHTATTKILKINEREVSIKFPKNNTFTKYFSRRSISKNKTISLEENENLSVEKNVEKYHNIFENVLVITPLLDQSFMERYDFLLKKNSKFHIDSARLTYLLDAIYVAIAKISMESNSTESNSRIFSSGSQKAFSGELAFDHLTRTRHFNYAVWDVIKTDNQNKLVQSMVIDMGANGSDHYKISVMKSLLWSSYGQPSNDWCQEKHAASCPAERHHFQIRDLILVLATAIFTWLMSYIVVVAVRKRKEWRALLIGPNKLFLTSADVKTASSFSKNNTSCRDYGSRIGSFVTFLEGKEEETKEKLGNLKGDYVFLKPLSSELKDFKGVTRDALRQLRELRHENLCEFHGLFTNEGYHFLVMEYAIRKSLDELLKNKNCELNWTFKISLIYDLVRGMKYLHSTRVHCHGRLKSRNCVVDGRFVLKITDYGVNQLLGVVGIKSRISDTPKDLLWTAPELLNDPIRLQIGTQKGDSYSFAIICQEVILREEPYSGNNLTPEEVIEKLKSSPTPLRPIVPNDAAPNEILQIMKQCWQQEPEIRLTFGAIQSVIKELNKGKSHNIVENMMQQLQDYSTHLEELVNTRTVELREEKRKTETLLMKMLPPSVAKLLIANKPILPETFECCTIYFSDICGFTTIAHSSTPLQVVDFLNDLYTCFDAIIENHEVYKVETIGDAYMVSSGIPKIIGDRHAEEAAIMALDIMSATTTFKIRHLPHITLRIRIGVHSGSAVAGVVGLTMPRYCLFGDTINTASRLETTGVPSRIHVSSDTKSLLDKSSRKFNLQERGKIELKGRGAMTTWWLLGLEGFNKPLPDPGKLHEPTHGLNAGSSKQEGNKSSNNSTMSGEVHTDATKVTSTNNPSERTTASPGLQLISTPTTSSLARSGSSFVVSTPLVFAPSLSSTIPSEVKRQQKISDDGSNPHKQSDKTSYRRKSSLRFGKSAAVAPCPSVNTVSKNVK